MLTTLDCQQRLPLQTSGIVWIFSHLGRTATEKVEPDTGLLLSLNWKVPERAPTVAGSGIRETQCQTADLALGHGGPFDGHRAITRDVSLLSERHLHGKQVDLQHSRSSLQ
jgi:hypothetical protein